MPAQAGHLSRKRIERCVLRMNGYAAYVEYNRGIGVSERSPPPQTNRDCATAASTNPLNSGCASNGFDFSSGWNCTPMNHG